MTDKNTPTDAASDAVVNELNAMDGELSEAVEGYRSSLGKRVLFWCIRWLIGFGIIAVVVANKPEWSWLWWVGVGVAGMSLLVLLVSHVVLQRKIASVKSTVDEVHTALDLNDT